MCLCASSAALDQPVSDLYGLLTFSVYQAGRGWEGFSPPPLFLCVHVHVRVVIRSDRSRDRILQLSFFYIISSDWLCRLFPPVSCLKFD